MQTNESGTFEIPVTSIDQVVYLFLGKECSMCGLGIYAASLTVIASEKDENGKYRILAENYRIACTNPDCKHEIDPGSIKIRFKQKI